MIHETIAVWFGQNHFFKKSDASFLNAFQRKTETEKNLLSNVQVLWGFLIHASSLLALPLMNQELVEMTVCYHPPLQRSQHPRFFLWTFGADQGQKTLNGGVCKYIYVRFISEKNWLQWKAGM